MNHKPDYLYFRKREAGLFNRKNNEFSQIDLYTREGYPVCAILESFNLVYTTRKTTSGPSNGITSSLNGIIRTTKWGTPGVINDIKCIKQEIPEICPAPSTSTNSYYGFDLETNRNRGKERPLWEARSPLSKIDSNKNIPLRCNLDPSTSRSLKLQDMLRNFDTSGGSADQNLVIPGEICVVRIDTGTKTVFKRGRIVPQMHYSKQSELRIYLSDESKSIQADHKDVFTVNYKMHANLIEAMQLRRPEEPLDEFEMTENNLRTVIKSVN